MSRNKEMAEALIDNATRGGAAIPLRHEDQIRLAQAHATLAVADEVRSLRDLLETEIST